MPSCAGCTRSAAAEDSRASFRRGAYMSLANLPQATAFGLWITKPFVAHCRGARE